MTRAYVLAPTNRQWSLSRVEIDRIHPQEAGAIRQRNSGHSLFGALVTICAVAGGAAVLASRVLNQRKTTFPNNKTAEQILDEETQRWATEAALGRRHLRIVNQRKGDTA